MRYLVTVLNDGRGSPGESDRDVVGEFNDRLKAAGHWVFADGLEPPETATVVDNRGADPVLTDGPFLETKEHIVGLWIIEAADRDEAVTLATEASRLCNAKLEVRPFGV